MIVHCENCSEKYELDESTLDPPGIRIGCSNCGKVFLVEIGKDQRDHDSGNDNNTEEDVSRMATGRKAIEWEKFIDKSEESDSTIRDNYNQKNIDKESNELDSIEFIEIENPSDEKVDSEFIIQSETNELREGEGLINDDSMLSGGKLSDRKFQNIQNSDRNEHYNWQGLSLDDDLGNAHYKYPELFDETIDETINTASEEIQSGLDIESRPTFKRSETSSLIADQNKLEKATHEKPKVDSQFARTRRISKEKSGFSFSKSILNFIIALLFLVIIAGAVTAIILSMDLGPELNISSFGDYLKSRVPFNFPAFSSNDIIVTDSVGTWESTRNGPVYVISGHVTNKSESVINYVKLKSDFLSAGENVYEQTVYAGNTITENELKILPISDAILKLKRKSGDIDFENPRKLAGLNYAIEPGETVPFFTIFPSKNRVLGLKYDIKVVDYEKVELD